MRVGSGRCESVRSRDDDLRDIDLTSLEEIGRAVRLILKSQLGMNRPDLLTQTARLLGFSATSAKTSGRIELALQRPLDAGAIAADANGIVKAV
jgi:hypothetical protein